MYHIIRLFLSAIAITLSNFIIPGVRVDGFWSAILAAAVLGLVNTFIKPILVLLSLPVTVLTLGLFLLVINAALIMLVSKIVPGFHVDGFWWAMLFSVIITVITSLLNALFA